MKRTLIVIFVLLSFAFIPISAFAFDNWQASPWIDEEPYMEKTIHKLGFGILNTATGWTSVLFEPMRESNKFTGLLKGTWRTLTNTVGGALHVITFPFPFDIPLPDGGVYFTETLDDSTVAAAPLSMTPVEVEITAEGA